MKKLLLFTLFLTQILFPQLKEMEVKVTENRGGIPIFRDYPDKAGIIFYTQFDNLSFYSSYGIHNVMGDPASGKYVVIIEPARQSLEIRCPGHKSEIIKLNDLQPRDVLYYEVLPKKDEGIGGVTEVGVTIQVSPSDAEISIDGVPVKHDQITPLRLGKHTLSASKSGYRPYTSEIEVSPTNTFFKVTLEQVKLAQVEILSVPQGAEIKINGDVKGVTDKGLFLFPGDYELSLGKDEYLPVNQKITITRDDQKNKFKYTLIKNRGNIVLNVLPSNAIVKLNGERISDYRNIEVKPGNYTLEVTADQHLPFSEKFEISLGSMIKRDIKLEKNTGKLKLTTAPDDAIILVNKERQNSKEIEQAPGLYEVTVKKETYRDQTFTIEIKKGDLLRREVKLVAITGSLQFAVTPLEAKVMLEREGKQVESWKGMKIIDKVRVGEYDLTVKFEGYKTIKKGLSILENKTTIEDIQMTTGDGYTYKNIETDLELTDGRDDLISVQSVEEVKKDTKEEEKKDTKEEVFTFAEEMPSFPGGDGALYGFLAQNIAYPEIAKRAGVEGQVIVMFTVSKTGQIASPRVVRGIGGGCDEEALRVVMMMPRWNPGKEKGQPVNVLITVPIRFE